MTDEQTTPPKSIARDAALNGEKSSQLMKKREDIAKTVMSGIIASGDHWPHLADAEHLADMSVFFADALLRRLER